MKVDININDKMTVKTKTSEIIKIDLKIEEYIDIVLKKEGSV